MKKFIYQKNEIHLFTKYLYIYLQKTYLSKQNLNIYLLYKNKLS